jgi:hypothetical protein
MTPFHPRTRRQVALVRCEASGHGEAHRPSLVGQCLTCGATTYDWRRLLGIGARTSAYADDGGSLLLTHPRACGECGASDLLVTSCGPVAP